LLSLRKGADTRKGVSPVRRTAALKIKRARANCRQEERRGARKSSLRKIVICRVGRERPVRFAARELARYLTSMLGTTVETRAATSYDPDGAGIWLGVAYAFGDAVPVRYRSSKDLFDDGIYINANGEHAVIAGANPRSVVFAAYRFLEELGCRWFRPGPKGERVPRVTLPPAKRIHIAERPSARHRCICIEGSCSFKHVRDMIDYSAKRGFNAYFFQFRDAFPFFNIWYGHERFAGKPPRNLTSTESMDICDRAKRQATKRGIIIHSVGHGWTSELFGIHPTSWGPDSKLPPGVRQYFAMIRGKRGMFPRVPATNYLPLITNLCYSNPKVRSLMAEDVVEYAESHPREEVIHVWLADGNNNNCECENCRKARPSDFYVQLLNEIDERLTERGLATRIVFLAYVDLLWAPTKSRIANPDRFILMFAPITRSYTTSFLERPPGRPEKVPPYVRNKLTFPKSPQTNLKMLEKWKRRFDGQCVDFDYHLWTRSFSDPTLMQMSKVLFKDIGGLHKLGMDGFISCQYQRVAFPTGIALHVMGKTLWDRGASYDRMVHEYLADLFGERGSEVRKYLEKLASLFDPTYLRGDKHGKEAAEEAKAKWGDIPTHVEGFRPVIKEGLKSKEKFRAHAWKILEDHAWYSRACADLFRQLMDKEEEAVDTYIRIESGLMRRRSRLTPVLDVHTVLRLLRGKIVGRR